MKKCVLVSMAVLSLTACSANRESIHWEVPNDSPKTIVMDAKQRALTSSLRDGKLVVCAEKSPDVFAVLSASGSGSIAYKEIAAKAAFSSTETGANIGLRTQLTQAQAEYLYRLCEQYANGAINRASVETELRRFPTTIVALLAIEQLTGYAKPNFMSVGGKSSAGVAADLGEMQKAVDVGRGDNEGKQRLVQDLDKAVNDAEIEVGKKSSNKQAIESQVDTKAIDKEISEATNALSKATEQQKGDGKQTEEAQKTLDAKRLSKQKLIDAVDTTAADKAIKEAQEALNSAQSKQPPDTGAIQTAQKNLEDKKAAKQKILGAVDTASVDKEIVGATDALEKAKAKQLEDSKAVQVAQKSLDDKIAAKQKLLGPEGEKAQKEFAEAQLKLKEAMAKRAAARTSLADSAANLKRLEDARDAAASAITAGTSSLPSQYFEAQGSSYYQANPESVQAVSQAVTEIVKTVTNQTFTTEVCLKAFFEDEKIHSLDRGGALQQFCTDWMKDINKWKFEHLHLSYGLNPDGIGTNSSFSKPNTQAQVDKLGPAIAPVSTTLPTIQNLPAPSIR